MQSLVVAVLALAASANAFTTSRSNGVVRSMPRRAVPSLRMAATLPETPAAERPKLAPEDEWIGKLDLQAFGQDIRALGKKLESEQGEADVRHIKKICRWSNACAAVGLLSMGLAPNPVTVMALSLWTFSRWTTIAHHTCHGGYNTADKTRFFNSKGFALGSVYKRATQWFDWMLPEAWNVEHNNLHHYRLGERDDPDLVERNLAIIRDLNAPPPIKYAAVGFLMCTWKWFYYAPNTYKELTLAEMRRKGIEVSEADGALEAFTLKAMFDPLVGEELRTAHKHVSMRGLWTKVLLPYLIGHFVLLPLPFLALGGQTMFFNAVANLVLADVVTNVHAFITIATNHAGSDLYMFDRGCKPNSGTFYLRQVISSANFRTGSDVNDFMHGWLNYQVEHHLWPQLSALSYQKAQPQVKAICDKHGVPYVQESVWIRLKKTVDIMVGKASMRHFPGAYEHPADEMVWNKGQNRQQSAAEPAMA